MTDARVEALYRYPIKGLGPEKRRYAQVQGDGRIAGDRVLAFRHADAAEPEWDEGREHWPKGGGLCVRDYPRLVQLQLEYTAPASTQAAGGASNGRVVIRHRGRLVADAGLDSGGRSALEAAMADFVLTSDDGARLRRPGKLPLVLVGDGRSAKFQDRARGFVTVHSRSSLRALEQAVGTELDEVRFRSNIAIDGLEAWREDELIGGRVRIGGVTFSVHAPIIRCLATHANPATGERDAAVMTTLTRVLGKEKPGFGVLLVADGPGRIDLGSEVEVLELPEPGDRH